MARILIAGCGAIGRPLGVRLVAAGHLVWGLRRDPSDLPVTLTPVQADVLVPNTLRRLPDVDLVYYLVAPAGGGEEAWRQAYVDGPRYLLEVMRRMKLRVRRFFFGSCVDVYGDRGGDWVDEDSEIDAEGRRRFLAQGEALVAEAPMPTTVLRLGELYGPGHPGLLARVLDEGAPVRAPRRHANPIHLDDAVGAMVHLAGVKKPEPTYVVVDREPAARVSMLSWMAERAGRPMPPVDGGDPPAGGSDVRAMSERLVESGYHFVHPTFRDGYGDLIRRVTGR